MTSPAGGPLIASAPSIGTAETFDLLVNADGTVSLRASNGLYVSAENFGASPLIASRPAVSTWESFDLI